MDEGILMGFVWVTDVGVGASIDAADRNETKDHVSELYTALGKNWPGNVRFPVCVGAGYDLAEPCPVVWPIAPDDTIYQTLGAHPVSELQEARDKLDWLFDGDICNIDNIGHDNPENAAANPTTLGAANPVTNVTYQPGCGADCPSELGAANDVTQSAENPITNTSFQPGCDSDCPLELGAANPITQDAENPITNTSFEPGCGADCPLEDGAANPETRATAFPYTKSAVNPYTHSVANPYTQSAENPITNTTFQPGCDSDCPDEDSAANDVTQDAENPITNTSFEPGCDADCPLEDGAANPATNFGEDSVAWDTNWGDLGTNKGMDNEDNSGVYSAVQETDRLYELSVDDHCPGHCDIVLSWYEP